MPSDQGLFKNAPSSADTSSMLNFFIVSAIIAAIILIACKTTHRNGCEEKEDDE